MTIVDSVWNMVFYGILGFFFSLVSTSFCGCVSAAVVSFAKKDQGNKPQKHIRKFASLCYSFVFQSMCLLIILALILPISFILNDICEVM